MCIRDSHHGFPTDFLAHVTELLLVGMLALEVLPRRRDAFIIQDVYKRQVYIYDLDNIEIVWKVKDFLTTSEGETK